MSLTIAKVERLAAVKGMDYHIDVPIPGTMARHSLNVSGWAFDAVRPLSEIEVVQSGLPIATATIDGQRPDVNTAHTNAPATPGFSLTVPTANVEHDFRLLVRARRPDGSVEDLARIAGARADTEHAFIPRMQPLILTSLARTGSTWLMRLLAAHPALVAYRIYPYEIRPALYWLHALEVLTQRPVPGEFPVGTDPIVPTGEAFVGHNPFFDWPSLQHPPIREWFETDYVEDARNFCLRSIDEFYERLALTQKQPQARLYVEKFHIERLSELALLLYPRAREIILVRDPRDVVASVFAFDEKRGMRAFGRERMTDDDFLVWLSHSISALARGAQGRADRAIVVRYEDLVADPAASLSSVLRHVGVDGGAATIKQMIAAGNEPSAEIDEHRTSTNARESINRWRRDLSVPMQVRCNSLFADSLKFFGYEPA